MVVEDVSEGGFKTLLRVLVGSFIKKGKWKDIIEERFRFKWGNDQCFDEYFWIIKMMNTSI